MRCTHNPPGLFKEQRRRGWNTWPAATRRLLSIHLVRDNQTSNQAEKCKDNPTKHHISLKTEDRNLDAGRCLLLLIRRTALDRLSVNLDPRDVGVAASAMAAPGAQI